MNLKESKKDIDSACSPVCYIHENFRLNVETRSYCECNKSKTGKQTLVMHQNNFM